MRLSVLFSFTFFLVAIFLNLFLNLNDMWFVEELNDDVIELQPALVKLFNRRTSDEVSAKESIKEHLWDLHFAEYGRSV